jgi:hypothetical protein
MAHKSNMHNITGLHSIRVPIASGCETGRNMSSPSVTKMIEDAILIGPLPWNDCVLAKRRNNHSSCNVPTARVATMLEYLPIGRIVLASLRYARRGDACLVILSLCARSARHADPFSRFGSFHRLSRMLWCCSEDFPSSFAERSEDF